MNATAHELIFSHRNSNCRNSISLHLNSNQIKWTKKTTHQIKNARRGRRQEWGELQVRGRGHYNREDWGELHQLLRNRGRIHYCQVLPSVLHVWLCSSTISSTSIAWARCVSVFICAEFDAAFKAWTRQKQSGYNRRSTTSGEITRVFCIASFKT